MATNYQFNFYFFENVESLDTNFVKLPMISLVIHVENTILLHNMHCSNLHCLSI